MEIDAAQEQIQQTTPESTQPSTQPTQPVQPAPVAPVAAPTTPAAPVDENAVTEKVTKTVIERIAEGFGITKKEEVAKIPTDPEELAKFVQDNAKKATEQLLTEREQREKEAQEAQQKQITEGAQRFQTLWKSQYEELAATGRVPKITNPADKNDPGNVAKVKILTKLSEKLRENQANGVDYVPTLKEIFYEHPDILSTATTTGATAPISGGGRAMATGGGLTYDQLHNADTEDLIKAKYNQ